MDGRLIAELKHDVHLFYPMVFPPKLPPRMELFDKLTFIAKNSPLSHCCCCRGDSDGNNDQQE
jgi:hypothetical protein